MNTQFMECPLHGKVSTKSNNCCDICYKIEVENSKFLVQPEDLMMVSIKPVYLSAAILKTQKDADMFKAQVGDYVLIMQDNNCVKFAKNVFEQLFQTSKNFHEEKIIDIAYDNI